MEQNKPVAEPTRAHPRYELVAPVRFEEPAVAGQTVNISFGGLAFQVADAQALPLGGVVRFTIELRDGEALTLTANLCWRAGTACGVAFDGLSRAQRLKIEALIDALRVPPTGA